MRDLLGEDVILAKLKARTQRAITSEFLREAQWDGYFEAMQDEMVVTLTTFVLAEKLAEKLITVQVDGTTPWYFPKSPWHFFRYRHPRFSSLVWTVTRRPIQYIRDDVPFIGSREVKTEQFATFPASPIRTPEKFRGPIVVRYEEAS